MRSRTIRLLTFALGIGSLAGAGFAQEADASAAEETVARSARGRGYSGQTGYGGSVESEFAERPAGRRAGRLQRSRAMDDSFGAQAEPSTRTAPFDDSSAHRSRRTPSGPDAELGETEVMRLSGDRRRAAGRGEPNADIRRIDAEIDKIDEHVRQSRPVGKGKIAQRSNHDADDAPMRASWRGAGPGKKLRAPFSDDPDGEAERGSASTDPRHAARPVARKAMETDEEASPAPRKTRTHEAAHGRAESAVAAPPVRESTTHKELMAMERQMMLLRRKGAPSEEIDGVQSRAAKLRASWRQSIGGQASGATAASERDEAAATYRRTAGETEPDRTPFWRRDDGAGESNGYEHSEGEGHDVNDDREPAPRSRHF